MFQKYLTHNAQTLPGSSTGIVLDGRLIQSVQRGSPAAFCEVALIGETITHVDQKPVDANSVSDLLKGNDTPGENVTLKFASGETVVLVRDSASAMKSRGLIYDEIAEDEQGKKLLDLIEPFLKFDPWRPAPGSTHEKSNNELPPSRSLQDLQTQLDKANRKLSQYEMLQQRISALETQLKDARSTLAQKSQTPKTSAEVEHLRRCNKALQSTLDSLLTIGESVTVSSPVIAQAQDMPLSPQKVHFALTLPSESGIRAAPHDSQVRKCDFCALNDGIVGKWKVLRRAFVQQQLDHEAEIEEATRSILRLRECLVRMQPPADAPDEPEAPAAPAPDPRLGAQV